MKKVVIVSLGCLTALTLMAQPLRVALLDFENQAVLNSQTEVLGGIEPESVAKKGFYVLSASLANEQQFVLIDRRDFLGKLSRISARKGKEPAVKPSFLRAAQAVNADAIIRGNLLSYAPGKQIVNQGGYKTEFLTLSIRVGLEALDTQDGAVIAAVDGAAHQKFRQSQTVQQVLGEDEIFEMLKEAVNKALPSFVEILNKRFAQERARPQVKLSVKTNVDPAIVEIDGMIIGTTPITNFEVYAGDHVLSVGKAGYRDLTQNILLKSNTSIEIPLLRIELSAEELKDVLEKMRMNVFLGLPEPALIINTIESEEGK